ncbi:hypothetical protein [Streptomyces sp. NPDC002573]|uniref:hypothetical protein n=1 Tax=Streptomyces sp. NPDC002573 TaxID=3364651 RepID=UPI0036851501
MRGPDDVPGIALSSFERPGPDGTPHPVLAAVLAELRAREAEDDAPAAYYGDSPDPLAPRPPAGAAP